MMVSSRGRYALRVMVDIAENGRGDYIPMKEVSERQDISLKYMEKIMPALVSAGLVEGVHGKGGGYRLKKAPEECRVGEILRLTEGSLAPVACVEAGAEACGRCETCRTYPLWEKFGAMTDAFFDSVTLADLMKKD